MEAEQLPEPIREFTDHLRGLLARLDRSGGWCAVFWQRDPDGMRACLDGREPPPWDVVESLLQDLAAGYGPGAAAAEAPAARSLHAAALAAYDARPGARDALGDRLDVMLREQRYAAERRAELALRLASATTREEADALGLDLAWADDDHRRATARCAEITARLTSPERREGTAGRPPPIRSDAPDVPGRPEDRHPAPGPHSSGRHGPGAAHSAPAPGRRGRRRGGARFAGAVDEEAGPLPVPPAAVPGPPAAAPAARGARFAGAARAVGEEPRAERRVEAADRREAGRIVGVLARLRAEGRGGEAHAVLSEAAHWPAVRFPLLADEMARAGLEADWATLLWEAASLPADRLVAAADALTGAGRAQDGERILRQGVVRPAGEIGRAVLALTARERHREAGALLDACVRMRTPEDAARTAAEDPRRLVPLLLTAARGVSEERHRDLLHALRVAGLAA
ncbi:hypothetical protein ACF1AE_04335 [Streptomyces sp. NPDC014986]|uniref:hypothetical protein n=1 Tax=Streptomyces sp. NPDC014986 TaxID=3364934 RepID=UPI0036F94F13